MIETPAKITDEINRVIAHIQENQSHLHRIPSMIERAKGALQEAGAQEYLTPIITHGMMEYRQSQARIIFNTKEAVSGAALRHSPEFEKQLLALATGMPYMQVAPACRPGDMGPTHVPYLHQLDTEFPYTKETSYSQAAAATSAVMQRAVVNGMQGRISNIIDLSFDEAVSRFGSENPAILNSDQSFTLAVVRNPPLFKIDPKTGLADTTILPMAQPIWPNKDMELAFKQGQLTPKELLDVRVHGYDFILSSPIFNRPVEGGEEGIEVAGGSVRISDPGVQRRVLEYVRPDSRDVGVEPGFFPLIALLERYQETGMFTAGGAIGIERLAMALANVNHISKIVTLPWYGGIPPFAATVKQERRKRNEAKPASGPARR